MADNPPTAPARPLPASDADVAAKAAANAAAVASAAPSGPGADGTAAAPTSGGPAYNGQFSSTATPPDTTGAIGTTRYVQLVNRRFGIYDRTSGTPISSGTLTSLLGFTASHFDPQILWDPSTNRFYFAMDSTVSTSDHKLSVGWSKTASPSGPSDFCKYTISFGSSFPDFPKLGDSSAFVIIGTNIYDTSDVFQHADVYALGKPPSGTTCPSASSLAFAGTVMRTPTASNVFSPTPANGVDGSASGVVVARNRTVPSNQLWTLRVTKATDGTPVFSSSATAVTLPSSYSVPPDATQPSVSQRLDTSDTRLTQAVMAVNPRRTNTFSLWTQQTVANGSFAAVRWYEINPFSSPPSVRASGTIVSSSAHVFNAAISPDRRVQTGSTSAYGGSWLIGYSVSSPSIFPRIDAGSSVNGAAPTFFNVRNGVGPNVDFSCATAGSTCRWGDYSAASPDPASATGQTVGAVWITNQYAGSTSTSTTQSNWRTRIAALRP